jgi:prolyl-tRNA editing enzyme YbaK/EbsC (Cys-tRNA(Pro) deacylase)
MQSRPVPAFRREVARFAPAPPDRPRPSTLDAMAAELAPREFPFELLAHDGRDAGAVAHDLGLAPEARLSVALLSGETSDWLAITQVTRLLDLAAAAWAVAEPELTLAGPDDLRVRFGEVEAAALCPLASGPGLRHLVDRPVLDLDRTLCAAGRHYRSLLLEPRVLVELLWPVVSHVTLLSPGH